eukprot:COSAG01_NODE_3847_length_5644_cov_25.352209_6_plen_108_part_00
MFPGHHVPPAQQLRVRVEIMGSQKCRIVGKSQSVLIMIDPIISTLTSRAWHQVGPGHASFVLEAATSRYFSVYHASPGQNCDRHAFVEEMRFDDASTKWPYIWFGAT